MPIKNFLQRFQPTQLYIILVLSICYFSVQLVLSHLTHALTLLMASYHMLCNIFALAGCIVTIKHSKRKTDDNERSLSSVQNNSSNEKLPNKAIIVTMSADEQTLAKRERREMKLRNTFGWTRIDILTMLIVCIILASLSFSLLVEALQTLVHIDHQDTMHLPIPVLILGCVGLILNGLTYFLIGGYTLHQGSFLHLTPSGNVVLNRAMSNSGELTLKADERQLSKSRNDQQLKEELQKEIGHVHFAQKRQGAVEMLRDVSSTIFVIVCAVIVYMAQDEEHTAKFIDPVLSIFSCVLLVSLSYPYMKESCLILLQTIPGSINMENFERTLVSKFPEIVSYHDLHIWQLSAHKYVATVHIKFQSPKLYTKIIDDVKAYFHEQGITEVTIQPEFDCAKTIPSLECLVQCATTECAEKVCCKDSRTDLREVGVAESSENISYVPDAPKVKESEHSRHSHSHKERVSDSHNHSHGHSHSHSHNHSHNHNHSHTHSNKIKKAKTTTAASFTKAALKAIALLSRNDDTAKQTAASPVPAEEQSVAQQQPAPSAEEPIEVIITKPIATQQQPKEVIEIVDEYELTNAAVNADSSQAAVTAQAPATAPAPQAEAQLTNGTTPHTLTTAMKYD